ncbi:hypothetical protein CsSME_00006452 [Camellia sinensis var. sinensis]
MWNASTEQSLMASPKCKLMTSLCRSEQLAQRSVNAIRTSYSLTSRSIWHIDHHLGHRPRPVFILSAIRNRENLCPHVCVLQCHPSLCPLCKAFAPPWLCPYGKKIITSRYPIPTCSKVCGKCLSCGVHHCKERCHVGDCAPCMVLITQKCRCRSSYRTMECYKTMMEEENFHVINLIGGRRIGRGTGVVKGKGLRSGQYSCSSLCHSGHCPPCLETVFTDLTCSCERNSIPPPHLYSTLPPSCQYPCSSCHFGECPPRSVPIVKERIGGHVVLCGKTRQCGMHACARTCHLSPCDSSCGPSFNLKASSGQMCDAPKRKCRHACTALYYPFFLCPNVRCEFPVTITCSCDRIITTVPSSIIQKLLVQCQPIETNGKKIPLDQRRLMCDDECEKMERKRAFAVAFCVTIPNLDTFYFGKNFAISKVLVNLFRRDPKWVLFVKERCKFLVLGRGKTILFAFMYFEPMHFTVVHVTPKSKPLTRVLGAKVSIPKNILHPPIFDPLIDLDPRLLVALFDLPRDANISALVLRFGSECELVWLNDKNALVVFSDLARAATAMKSLDQGSVYYGVILVPQNGCVSVTTSLGANTSGSTRLAKDGGTSGSLKRNPWKEVIVQEPNLTKSSWGGEKGRNATI